MKATVKGADLRKFVEQVYQTVGASQEHAASRRGDGGGQPVRVDSHG